MPETITRALEITTIAVKKHDKTTNKFIKELRYAIRDGSSYASKVYRAESGALEAIIKMVSDFNIKYSNKLVIALTRANGDIETIDDAYVTRYKAKLAELEAEKKNA